MGSIGCTFIVGYLPAVEIPRGNGDLFLTDYLIFFNVYLSLSILLTILFGIGVGMFWCLRKDFDAIGGFDEKLICVEDADFGKRLKRYGKACGKRYCTIRKAHIITSCRKFDQFGDWYIFKNPTVLYRLYKQDQAWADQFYYNTRSDITEPDV